MAEKNLELHWEHQKHIVRVCVCVAEAPTSFRIIPVSKQVKLIFGKHLA
jgi:hypothetical protein